MAARKTPAKTPAEKRTPAHGGGALLVGNPGNAGGPGRPPSEIRKACRDSFYVRIPILEKIADDQAAKDKDRVGAVLALGKIGMAGAVSLEDVRERLLAQWQVLKDELPPDLLARVVPKLSAVWT